MLMDNGGSGNTSTLNNNNNNTKLSSGLGVINKVDGHDSSIGGGVTCNSSANGNCPGDTTIGACLLSKDDHHASRPYKTNVNDSHDDEEENDDENNLNKPGIDNYDNDEKKMMEMIRKDAEDDEDEDENNATVSVSIMKTSTY
uniref:Uncharacterized protein n=1 Tax=Stomoxys calcitrans TaxID=35570 RepID=A0A1I8QAJ8_STOCA|nr:unnamed protein product [Stomoxys calcitrans]